MKPKFRVLVVDDEPAARRGLKRRLEAFPEIAEVELCDHGVHAIQRLKASSFDLVLLDIQMPECDGFDVVEQVGPAMPPVVFVTAYDAFALQAFEIHALDYLLKPIDPERFHEAIRRIFQMMAQDGKTPFQAKLTQLRGDCRTAVQIDETRQTHRKLMIRDKARYYLVDVAQILYIQVEGNYLQIVAEHEEYWPRETLTNLLHKLGEDGFLRLSRNLAVNQNRIAELRPLGKGAYTVVLKGGQTLQSSRHYRQGLKRFFESFQ